MYPLKRNRRLRSKKSLRNLVRETTIHPHDFIVPLFLVEGKNIKDEIPSMPNYYRFSLDNISKEVKQLWSLGVQAVLLFAKVPESLKDNYGTEALNNAGLMQRGIKEIKDCVPEITIMTDVALDPYSNFGHDGVVENNEIINDKTNEILSRMALSHAEAGADVVAPSDMMDGRVLSIRNTLEKNGFHHTGIMSYAVKYASNFYGPFRDAVGSSDLLGKSSKETYQMDPANSDEALNEVELDIKEGADMVMIKPGMPYLDIVFRVKQTFNKPTFVYQVSGEYAMIMAASLKGWLNQGDVILESLISFRRAGADAIITYFALEVARLMDSKQ